MAEKVPVTEDRVSVCLGKEGEGLTPSRATGRYTEPPEVRVR